MNWIYHARCKRISCEAFALLLLPIDTIALCHSCARGLQGTWGELPKRCVDSFYGPASKTDAHHHCDWFQIEQIDHPVMKLRWNIHKINKFDDSPSCEVAHFLGGFSQQSISQHNPPFLLLEFPMNHPKASPWCARWGHSLHLGFTTEDKPHPHSRGE